MAINYAVNSINKNVEGGGKQLLSVVIAIFLCMRSCE